jgi:PAS domain S-box-containing protein
MHGRDRQEKPDAGSGDLRHERRRYQSIFRHSAVALWEEDISALRRELAALKARGVTDLGRHIAENPAFLAEAAQLVIAVDVNDAALTLYEAESREQLLGPLSRTLDLEDPVVRASFAEDILQVAGGGHSDSRESHAVTPTGRQLVVEIRLWIPEESDPYQCMLVNVLDITAQKRAEDALRESERNSRALFDAAQRQARELELLNQVGTTIARELDLPVVFRTVVEAIARSFGYTQVSLYLLRGDTLVCQHQVGYTHVIAEIPVSQGISGRVARTGSPVLLPDVRSDPEFLGAMDGIVSELCIPLLDQGKVVGTLNVESTGGVVMGRADFDLMTALGEQVSIALVKARLYGEARESEQRYRTLVEKLGEGVAIVDPTERFLFANPAAELIFGVPPGELAGRGLEEFLGREEFARARAETEKRRRGETSVYEQDIRRPDTTVRRLEITASPQYDADGSFAWTLGVFRDITEARRTEEALRRSEERLAQAQKMEAVGRLAGGIAHDFNNLLTVIRGYADLVEKGIETEQPVHDGLREIRTAADRAAGLTAQLLAFSRKQVMRPRVLNLDEVVRGMQKMLPRMLGEDVRLVAALAAEPATILADQGQLEQVLMNLAANARDAMPAGGTLTLATATRVVAADPGREHPEVTPGRYVELCVTDTGRGIDRDILPRIFEPFFTTKALGQGTGLGLATVYGIIKQSEGYIYCASEPSAGTTFTILLPVVPGGIPETVPPPRDPRSLAGSETVLVVEDEQAIRELIRTVLRRNGYRVLTARNGEEALAAAAAEAGTIELLLTDVVMPRMSGPELGRRIREVCPNARVLYMSGFTDHPAVREGAAAEGEQLVRKPFTAEVLLERVRAALDAGPAIT